MSAEQWRPIAGFEGRYEVSDHGRVASLPTRTWPTRRIIAVVAASKAGHWKPGTIMSVSGHVAPVALAREIMGIDWTTREELAEAIPPYYTEHIGRQLIEAIGVAA